MGGRANRENRRGRAPHRVGFAILVVIGAAPAAQAAGVIDFDDLAPGTTVSTLPTATLGLSAPSASLVVSTGQAAPTAPNYLGAETTSGPPGDPQSLLLPGESVTLTFPSPTASLELTVVSTAGTPPDAFALMTAGGSTTSGTTPTLAASGDELWHLSIVSPQPFTSAELRAISGEEVFAFHVDDVVVPEPALAPALVAGLAFASPLVARSSRSRRAEPGPGRAGANESSSRRAES